MVEVEEIEKRQRERSTEIRGNPGLGIGIVNRLADNRLTMGGGSNPYGGDAILTPASARILYAL